MPNSYKPEKALLSDYERRILAVFSGRKTTGEISDYLNVSIDVANFLEGLAKELSRSVDQSISRSVDQSISRSVD
jgi:hypothetical protein